MSAVASPVRHRRVFTRVVGYRHLPPLRLHLLHRFEQGVPTPFLPLGRFFVERGQHRNLSFQRSYARSVGLLLDHLAAHGVALSDAGPEQLQHFVDDLVIGTQESTDGRSRSLNWKPASIEVAKGHLERINRFAEWHVLQTGGISLNPWRPTTTAERATAFRHYDAAARNALLGHAAMRREESIRAGATRTIKVSRRSIGSFDDVYAFDRNEFERLIEKGFGMKLGTDKPVRPQTIRNVLISILLYAGGLRECEPFHLFTCDVVPHPTARGQAQVWLFHPERGEAPVDIGGPWRDREHYLMQRHGLLPRTLEHGGAHAGWKNIALTDSRRKATTVCIVPDVWAETFWEWTNRYRMQRPKCAHPYLFVSHRGPQKGRRYTVGSFVSAHDEAVARCGLPVGKRFGTSPHGYRHAYGAGLADANVEPRFIRRALHHRSLDSQEIYKRATAGQIALALRQAGDRMEKLNNNQSGEQE